MTDMSVPLSLRNARPAIRIDGAEHAKVDVLLSRMQMRERLGGLSTLELRFVNWASDPDGGADYAFEDDRILRLGARVEAYAGDAAAPMQIFAGRISALEGEWDTAGPPELIVLAEDDLQRLRRDRRSTVYEAMSLQDVVQAVAAEAGLRARVDAPAARTDTWVRMNETGLAFLRRLLALHDGDLQAIGDELQVRIPAAAARNRVELRLHDTLTRVRVIADLAEQTPRVRASGWDPLRGRAVEATATDGDLGPGQGRTGPSLVPELLPDEPGLLAHPAIATDAEAEVLARAAWSRRARRFVRLHGEAEGDPELRVGSHVAIQGLGARFDNSYAVVEALHRFDAQDGYVTQFTAECARFGPA